MPNGISSRLIEDAAQAHGARFAGQRVGSFGHAAAFSFYPGKNLGALGDAGAVVTSDSQLADRIRLLANHGRDPNNRFLHSARGRNSRLDAIQAAWLSRKLLALDHDNGGRRQAAAAYASRLPDAVSAITQHEAAESVYHVFVTLLDDRDEVGASLSHHGIGWGLHYPVPCHLQPAFAEFATGPHPVTEWAANRLLSLPMFPHLSIDQIDRVGRVLHEQGPRPNDG